MGLRSEQRFKDFLYATCGLRAGAGLGAGRRRWRGLGRGIEPLVLRLCARIVLAADHGGRSAPSCATSHRVVDELRRSTARRHRIAGKIIAGGLSERLLIA
jgi:hypothetical protein